MAPGLTRYILRSARTLASVLAMLAGQTGRRTGEARRESAAAQCVVVVDVSAVASARQIDALNQPDETQVASWSPILIANRRP